MSRVVCLKYLFCWGLFFLVAGPPVRAQPAAKLTLQIVPNGYSSAVSPEAYLHCSHFHALLTNTSAVPVALFEEWNSWGYFGLSFDITYPDGRVVRVAKQRRVWDKNFASTVTIAPGGFYVFDVDFDPKTWQHSPLVEKRAASGSIRCRMRARYTIAREENPWSQKGVSIWTGAIASATGTYILWP
jgi:hypothetical protein